MKAELRNRWLAALRSGNYEQGTRYLCMGNRYCCLGVLAEIDGKLVHGGFLADDYEHISILPKEYQEEINLEVADARALMTMNDQGNKSFLEIADWIEANIPADKE